MGNLLTSGINFDVDSLDFIDLENRYGHENALAILRMLEQLEGVNEAKVTRLSCDERLQNVFNLMKDSLVFQTRH